MEALATLVDTMDALRAEPPPSVATVHAAHADFVWLSLQRLGVRDADLQDMHQEVFVVVHQRLHTFDGSSLLTTWLFGICLRVAAAYRRRAYVRREHPVEATPEQPSPAREGPEERVSVRQQSDQLRAILDELDLEKRAVFVMFEIDELSCDEIATITGAPLGTVFTRLRAARKQFDRAVARARARGALGGSSS
jgi:RNA polymerase sigma-70 factor (ECF subfamily)